MKMDHTRLRLTEAQAFVAEHHRHSEPLRRHIFSIGAHQPGIRYPILGVATVDHCSSAWSKRTDHVELRRLCTLGDPNVASFLLGKASQAVFAIGYRCLITYTQPHESGASLKAAGFWVQKRQKMVRYQDGSLEGGLVQWIRVRDYQPDQEERTFTKKILSETNAFAERQHGKHRAPEHNSERTKI